MSIPQFGYFGLVVRYTARVGAKHSQRDYDVLADEMFALRRSGQTGAAVKLFNERSDPLVLRLLAARQDLQSDSDIQAWEFQADRDYSIRTGQLILVVAFVFVIGAFVSGWLVTRLLASPLSALHYFEYE